MLSQDLPFFLKKALKSMVSSVQLYQFSSLSLETMLHRRTIWSIDGHPLNFSDPKYALSEDKLTLTITSLSYEDTGQYQILVFNDVGQGVASVHLNVGGMWLRPLPP